MKKQMFILVFSAISVMTRPLMAGQLTVSLVDGDLKGFNALEEVHDENGSSLSASGVGKVKPKFLVSPEDWPLSQKKLNRYIKQVQKAAAKGRVIGEMQWDDFITAKWKNNEDGSLEIVFLYA